MIHGVLMKLDCSKINGKFIALQNRKNPEYDFYTHFAAICLF